VGARSMRHRWRLWVVMPVVLYSCMAPRSPVPGRADQASLPWDAQAKTTVNAPTAGSLAYLDFTNGFRDLTFGDAPTPDMQLAEQRGETTLYRRPGDDLTLGRAGLYDLAYVFYTGRLLAILLKAIGHQPTQTLLKELQDTYGKGDRADPSRERYVWQGTRVLVVYDHRPLTDEALVVWQSLPLQQERDADKRGTPNK
jgi:hypothetical protein